MIDAPPPSQRVINRMNHEHEERVRRKANDYLKAQGFPQLDGEPLPLTSVLEAVLHYANSKSR